MPKKFILNAEGLGSSKAINRGVLEGYEGEFLKSATVMANGDAFEDAMENVLPKFEGLGVGIQLNISEGSPLCTDLKTVTDSNGKFNNSFFSIFLKAYNPKEKEFFPEIEREFRRQIEKLSSKTKITHISSVNRIHEIPKIFDLVCRLAKEYKIDYVRSSYEKFYVVPDFFKHFKVKYAVNFLKALLFDFLTLFNEITLNKYGIKTNDYFIGGIYDNMSDALTVSYGVSAIKYKDFTVECVIKPCRYDEGTIDNYFNEFLVTKNKKLKDKILRLGFEITNYVEENN